jgi:hypothetical protein
VSETNVCETNIFQLSQPGTFADPFTEVLRNGAQALLAQAIEAEIGSHGVGRQRARAEFQSSMATRCARKRALEVSKPFLYVERPKPGRSTAMMRAPTFFPAHRRSTLRADSSASRETPGSARRGASCRGGACAIEKGRCELARLRRWLPIARLDWREALGQRARIKNRLHYVTAVTAALISAR